ncbi:MAG: type IV secretion system protein [Alphaproteobacteria bacterium]|nr:type IV secretion system protein [Alphaproteobacteria bacterium]
MKNICNISQHLKKILVMLLLVVFLAACGKNDDVVVGGSCSVEDGGRVDCADVNDAKCLGCSIFTLMFNAVSVNVMKLHGQLTSGAMSLMMVCFSLWLAIRLLKFVSSVSESSISQVWNEIIRQGFLCLFCGILASSPSMLIYAVNTFVYPIYVAFLRLGIAIMEAAVTNSDDTASSFVVFGSTVTIAKTSMTCTFNSAGIITKNGYPPELLNTIVCMIKLLKHYLAIGGDISVTLMKQSSGAGVFIMGKIAGMVLMAFFWVVRIGFVFYLVDTIFQMGIIILLLPIFIMAYAFKKTREWTTIGIKNILASAGFLMCFSIIVTLVLRAMIELIVHNPSIFNPKKAEMEMANLGLGFLCLLLIGFLIYGSMGVSQQIVGSLIGGGIDANFQQKMRAALAKVKGWAMKGLGSAVSFGTSLLPATVQEKLKSIEAAKNKINRMAGRGQ